MSATTAIVRAEARVVSLWGEPVRLTWVACPQRAEVHYAYGRSARPFPESTFGEWRARR